MINITSVYKGGGKRIREAHQDARKRSAARYKCPSCSRMSMDRKASGVWECKKCSAVFASAAYEFRG
ncbi:MAG: hypothetical protein HY513_03030 [Candidatus Aenigmarchaeota archaeon]|nr:hypothetical protein [Candidatus Aenigmarchaeota archaeon]